MFGDFALLSFFLHLYFLTIFRIVGCTCCFLPGRPLPVINSPTLEGMPENGAKSDSLLQPPGSDAVMAPPVPEELYRTCTDVLGITVHGTDELKASIYLAHPSVKVSIMDVSNSGNLLKKSAPDKCVTSYYEGGNPSVDYILPVLTQPYDCIEHR